MAKRPLSEEESKIVEQLRQQHGDVRHYMVRDKLVVIRMATAADLHRYKDTLAKAMAPKRRGQTDGPSVADAERTLGVVSWVYPDDKAERAAILTAAPGLIGRSASDAETMAEAGIEDFEGNSDAPETTS
jgi:hypothetical protein